MQKNKRSNTKNIIIVLLLLITIISIGMILKISFFEKSDQTLPQPEEFTEELPDNGEEKLESEEGGGAVSLSFSNELTIEKGTDIVKLYFANPHKSNQDIVLRIKIEDTTIAQSGLITAGNQITKLLLEKDIPEQLSTGIYNGYLDISYYDPNTNEKATVNTQIPVNIMVQ